MTHLPVDHHLRPVYRLIAGICGAFILVFGIIGVVRTAGTPLFSRTEGVWVFGMRENLAFAIVSILGGLVILGATVIGRNVDHLLDMIAGGVFIAAGMLMLVLLQTSANFFDFSMSNCVVSFLLGVLVIGAGLYSKTRGPSAGRRFESVVDAERAAAAR